MIGKTVSICMHIFYLFIFIFSFSTHAYCTDSERFLEQLSEADRLISQNNIEAAVPLVKSACDEGHVPAACGFMAICYMHGQGVERNPDMAEKIFADLLNQSDESAHLVAAMLLEYHSPNGNDSLNKAIELYSSLASSQDREIAREAQIALDRIPTYQFFDAYNNLFNAYRKKAIKFQDFQEGIYRLDISLLQPKLRDTFINYSQFCTTAFKNRDDSVFEMAKTAGSTFIKTFFGGFIGLGESIMEATNRQSELDKTRNSCDQWSNALWQELLSSGISETWLNTSLNH